MSFTSLRTAPGPLSTTVLAVTGGALAACAALGIFLGTPQVSFSVAAMAMALIAYTLSGNQRLFCLWGLLLTAPFSLQKAFAISPHMGGASTLAIDGCDVFLIPLTLFILRDRIRGWRGPVKWTPIALLWGAMMLLGAKDVLIGPLRFLAFLEIVRMAKLFWLFFVLVNEIVRARLFVHAFAALTIGIAIQSIFAIIQYTFKANLGLQFLGEPVAEATQSATASVYLGAGDVYRAGGLFSHPNLLAGFLAMLLPICIASMFSRLAPILKFLVGITVSLGLGALIITLSRSGWLSFGSAFISLLLFSMLHPKLRLRHVMARVLVIAAILCAAGAGSGEIIRRFTESDPGALKFRFEMMDVAWDMVLAHPVFGIGLNGFVAHLPEYTNPPGPTAVTNLYGNNWPIVHNSYLVTWTEQGTAGFACLAGIYLCILWNGLQSARYLLDDIVYAINLGATCGVIAIMVDGIGSFFIDETASARVFWIVTALIFAARNWTEANVEMRRSLAKVGRAVRTEMSASPPVPPGALAGQ